MAQCPHCASSERQTKSGHTRTGSQRYRCKECQRIYTPDPKPLGYPDENKREAVRLYQEGTNFRRIGRVLGEHPPPQTSVPPRPSPPRDDGRALFLHATPLSSIATRRVFR